jgi:arsenate reductase
MRQVLFLCTGNSARSVIAEVLLRSLGEGRFQVFSAGSHPTGRVNPEAIRQLELYGHDVSDLRSKSWDEFCGSDAPPLDIVITVCDNAAGETCPVWNGAPVSAHWGVPDPAAVGGSASDISAAFEAAYIQLRTCVEALLLTPGGLTRSESKTSLKQIGLNLK